MLLIPVHHEKVHSVSFPLSYFLFLSSTARNLALLMHNIFSYLFSPRIHRKSELLTYIFEETKPFN